MAKGFVINLEDATAQNSNFRKVIYTAHHSQLVLMCLKPNEEIGMEVHERTDQFFRVESGKGKVVIDGQEFAVSDGFAVVVPAGAMHNVINTSDDIPLKVYTIYMPPHHKDGVVHATKEAAENDVEDHL